MGLPQFTQKAIDAIRWLVANIDAIKSVVGDNAKPVDARSSGKRLPSQASRGVNTPQLQTLTCALVHVIEPIDETGMYLGYAFVPSNGMVTSLAEYNFNPTTDELPTTLLCIVANRSEEGGISGQHILTDDAGGFVLTNALIGVYWGTMAHEDDVLPVFHVHHIPAVICDA